MPPLETLDRQQPAVLWPARGVNDYAEIIHDDPVPLMVRWKQKRTEAQDSNGNSIVLDATVIVDQKIVVGSLMWLGHIKDLPPESEFTTQNGYERMQVKLYNFAMDLKGRFTRHSVGLTRYKSSLPS